MNSIAPFLVAASAAIVFVLGAIHLLYTFHGPLLRPRDRELQARMEAVSPVITRQTTMWKAWVGFNASHSLGVILIGALYLLLATQHMQFLAQARSLLLVGIAAGFAYAWLAHQYWFRTPFICVAIATACFLAAFVLLHLA